MRFREVLVGCAALCGCPAASPQSLPPTTAATAATDASKSSTATPAGETAPPRPIPEGLTITNLMPRQFELTSDRALGIASTARIERRGDDGRWSPIESLDNGPGYRLVTNCDDTPPACVELAAGAKLRPIPLSGMSCTSQCNDSCSANA